MIELADVGRIIAAPYDAVWELVADFGRPDRLVPGIGSYTVKGEGVGMERIIHIRGMAVVEELLAADKAQGLLRYEIKPKGDAPLPGLQRYVATVCLRKIAEGRSELRWTARGSVEGDAAQVRQALHAMYGAGLDRVEALLCPAPRQSRS